MPALPAGRDFCQKPRILHSRRAHGKVGAINEGSEMSNGSGIALGAALGVAWGALFGDLAMSLALGTAFGALLEVATHSAKGAKK